MASLSFVAAGRWGFQRAAHSKAMGQTFQPMLRQQVHFSGTSPLNAQSRYFSSARATKVDHLSATGSQASVNDVFAVVQFPGQQHKVVVGDIINTHRIPSAQVGTKIEFDQVLLVGSENSTVVGRPTVPGAKVSAWVEEQTKDAKVLVFKRRRRKSSQRMQGHRSDITILRIIGIDQGEVPVVTTESVSE